MLNILKNYKLIIIFIIIVILKTTFFNCFFNINNINESHYLRVPLSFSLIHKLLVFQQKIKYLLFYFISDKKSTFFDSLDF